MRRLAATTAAFFATVVAVAGHAALPSAKPWSTRTISNGFSAIVVSEATGRVQDFWTHLYRHPAPGQNTPDLLYDAYFGVRASASGAKGTWAKDLPHPKPFSTCPSGSTSPCLPESSVFGYLSAVLTPAYQPPVPVVRDVRTGAGVHLTTLALSPWGLQAPALVVAARIDNPSDQPAKVDVALLLNFHTGAGAPQPDAGGERVQALGPRALLESSTKSAHRLLFRAIDGLPAASSALGPGTPSALEVVNPYQKFQQNQAFGPALDSGPGDDRVAGMLWPGVALLPGESTVVGALVLYGSGKSATELVDQAEAWLQDRPLPQILADEQQGWNAWYAQTKTPAGLTPEDRARLDLALMLLRMGQVREPDFGPPHTNQTPHGQIVASLPPGQWNITWPRDQAYAAVALAVSGHHAEARAALDFVRNGQVGQWQKEVGGPYLVSPTRYFGGGLEESDLNENGPNIELDDTGLYLWQAARYVEAAGDLAWLAEAWPQLRDLAGDLLVGVIDGTGMIQPDSSIWEVHWNGQQKHFTFTSLMAIRGLCGAWKLGVMAGQGKKAAEYRQAAQSIRAAIQAKALHPDGWLRGNLEEPLDKSKDVAVVEAFLDGTLAPDGPVATATLKAWQPLLAGGGPGYVRNDDGGEYDRQEWLFVDLRVLRLLQRRAAAGLVEPGLAPLEARVRAIADTGGGIVPELIATEGAEIGQFSGAVPMMGFGGGALALTLGGEAWGDDLSACLQTSAPIEPGPDAASGDTTAAEDAVAEDSSPEVAAADVPAHSDGPAELGGEIAPLADASDLLGPPAPQVTPRPAPDGGCQSAGQGAGVAHLAGFVLLIVGLLFRRSGGA